MFTYIYLATFFFGRQVSIYSGTKDNCNKFCTAGKDGQMIIWDVKVHVY